ncbi:LysR substrate-binding domain-containing protein [Burkholderia cenocepacia]|uniref:LysR family transcriptional regulator n=1 Tax=Burkholderia cenocepacia TaxID=95486 RepID=A0AAD0J1S6_9BURK|nr:LysR substrate-binding domain-containing protein [Burkholderia cenocepacia]AWG29682.1 LysR family transcriptional regulator [Burkholderia cenocepacia]PRE38289.1 LysR family transcriptional regulator [Burkholderia cenocepacia]RQV05846.1 LysR family transcriptional regulator [Burkholderia cenocepacia]HEM7881921.1 LysR family transcriptional regulator [Burkholderia cenocepacia]
MDERLRGVAEFVDVVESGSFAAAALRLGMTRSAVAKIVARLELRLGARLLQRTTRQLGLTDEGLVYYEQCRRLLAELGEAEAALDAGRREPAGRVRVSVPVLFGRQCVAPVVRRLVERHPRLEIDMSFSDRVADLVNDGFDLAVRIGELADTSALVGRKLGVQRMGICASPAYLVRHGRPSGLDELASHVGIAYSRGGQPAPWRVIGADGAVHDHRATGRLRFDDLQAIADAAAAGAGLAWLPCWLMAPYLRDGRLALVMDSNSVSGAEVFAVRPAARHVPSKVRAVVDALVDEIPHMLASDDANGARA